MDDVPDSVYPVVNTHNEWDPLEEVIVGIVDGAMIPPWDVILEATLHTKELWDFHREFGGSPWPQELIDAARKDLDEFVHILEAEGVTVPTPHQIGRSRAAATP
jgi:glycine amidinotransferase